MSGRQLRPRALKVAPPDMKPRAKPLPAPKKVSICCFSGGLFIKPQDRPPAVPNKRKKKDVEEDDERAPKRSKKSAINVS